MRMAVARTNVALCHSVFRQEQLVIVGADQAHQPRFGSDWLDAGAFHDL